MLVVGLLELFPTKMGAGSNGVNSL